MKFTLQIKILTAVGLVGIICTGLAIFLATRTLSKDLEKALLEKSRAILSRLEVGAKYVSEMHTLDGIIAETITKFPNGVLPEEQKLKILRSVPIYAAFQIGKEGAAEEHYQFRIASDAPRNKDNEATTKELEVIQNFRKDNSLKEMVYKSEDEKFLSVVVPIRISESRNCLACHGHPSSSPWKNGKDILGYNMENMKDGDLRATFAIVSSMDPVHQAATASTKEIVIYGAIGTLISLLLSYLYLRGSFRALGELAQRVAKSSGEINLAAENLSAASQQLASSSQEQASSVEQVSSSLEQISGMVTSSVKSSEESVQSSNKVASLVAGGSQSMSELRDSVQKIAEANTRVESLAKLIEEIGEKTELIDEIVFQTRLLSFNASVEAERAGEHGRGFAVVAQEVGNLAQMSGKSATEISQIVKNSIKEAQEVVQISRSRVEQGVALCKKTAEQLASIEEASKIILGGSEQILRSSEEQNAGVQQINQSINLISQATQGNASAAEECSGSSQSLLEQGQQLANIVGEIESLVYGEKQQHTKEKNKSKDEQPKVAANVIALKKPKSQDIKSHHSNGNLATKASEDPWEKI